MNTRHNNVECVDGIKLKLTTKFVNDSIACETIVNNMPLTPGYGTWGDQLIIIGRKIV